ncbi:MAG: hypothetical protein GXO22_06455 [Aquificae bacterium]|nr:hypothetical protein [Aquificota bacterium]
MGGNRKKAIEQKLDEILIRLENGEIPKDFSFGDIDLSSLNKEEVDFLLKKVDYVISKISEKQMEIVKAISDKSNLKEYKF